MLLHECVSENLQKLDTRRIFPEIFSAERFRRLRFSISKRIQRLLKIGFFRHVTILSKRQRFGHIKRMRFSSGFLPGQHVGEYVERQTSVPDVVAQEVRRSDCRVVRDEA